MSEIRDTLKKLFSRNVVIKALPGGRVKTYDISKSQSIGSPTTYSNRAKWRNGRSFNSVSGYGSGFTNEEIEAIRRQMYLDYELMDTDAIVSSALDIFAEEATTVDIDGQLLKIKTDNERVKKILHNLFYDVMNIEFNLWSWIRTMCKYGDFFLYLQIAEEYGIVNVMPIHPSLMIREEGTREDPEQVRFKYEGDVGFYSGHNIFEEYEIAHFRMLTDTNFLPYGRSVIEPGKKVYKMMTLMEDAMLISRIMRAPERRIHYIDVGNIAPEEIDAHIEQIANEMKKVPYIDQTSGDYNLRYNMQPIAWYSNIPLLDGRTITIKELSDEVVNGIENWVYSIDHSNNNAIVPGKVIWCGLTKKDADIVRVTLDDASYIDFEPNHPVMLRDGSYISAKDLKSGDSVMPFYTEKTAQKGLNGYEMIYDPSTETYQITHRLVAKHLNIDNYQNTKNVVHHKDFNKINNHPNNLDCTMTFKEHISYHIKNASEVWNSKSDAEREEINNKRSISHKKRFENGAVQWSTGLTKETDERVMKASLKQTKEANPERALKISKSHTGVKRPNHSLWMKENYIPYERTPEFRQRLSEDRIGENSPNFGKTWKEMYGEDRYNELLPQYIERGKTLARRLVEWVKNPDNKELMSLRTSEENRRRYSDPQYKQKVATAMKDRFDEYLFEHLINIIKDNHSITCHQVVDEMNNIDGLYDYYLNLNAGRKKPKQFTLQTIIRAIKRNGFDNYSHFRNSISKAEFKNHKISKIEILPIKEDVYCMTVEKYHNFAIDSHGGTARNGIFVKNSMMEDYYLPVRGDQSGTKIDTLPGLQNEGMKEDVEYFKDKLLASLKIPKDFLGYGLESSSGKANLASLDIRFARTIERLQKIFVSELYKIAIIHLKVQGFKDEELMNFEIYLTNPSLVFERQKTDVMVAKVDLVKSIKEDNLFSDKYIYENIFGMSEDEWKADRDRVVEDAKHKFRLNQIVEEGNDPKFTGKSFGTPWDIATLQVSSKMMDGSNEESMKQLYTPDERERNQGKPPQYKSSFETKRDQDFGRDPVGRRENDKMDIPKESFQRFIKKLDKYKKYDVKKTLNEHKDISMLDDDLLFEETDIN